MRTIEQSGDALAAVSAVVVNHNAGHLLVECVRAALAQARQVIVVDNASSDYSLAMLESCWSGEPRLKTIRTGSNLGFAAACNVGVEHCSEDHLLFLNPDCVLGPDSLQRMVRTIEADAAAGMVGGLLLEGDGSEQPGGRRAVPTPWRSFVRAVGLTRLAGRWPRLFYDFHLHKEPLPDQPIRVEAISGALMLVRRAALDDVGLWDEGYFLHCEDLDWCMRFRLKGWDILFDPEAPAVHRRGACSKVRPIFVEWHKHKGMVRFYHKFFRHQYPGALMWLVTLGVWARFALVASFKACGKLAAQAPVLDEAGAKAMMSSPQNESAVAVHAGKRELKTVAVVGATSMVGQELLPMLAGAGARVVAYSREGRASRVEARAGVEWRPLSSLVKDAGPDEEIHDWVWLAPIRVLPDLLPSMRRAGARHVVAVSTTSRFTKVASSSDRERRFVEEIVEAEQALQTWARQSDATWTILRPTLIYGLGMDKNVNVIAKFIKRFRFFPVLGAAGGLRQPIHAGDVAAACKAGLERDEAANHGYNIAGAERLSYRAMVVRIFEALSIRPRFLSIPLWMFAAAVAVLRILPPFRSWSSAMAERMNMDMVFDNADAVRDLGFAPRPFRLDPADLPGSPARGK